ncbi:MAG: prolyl oligopeptidase family serine peptidase [Bacteroidota bacterium]|nr:prolyl oligopeptidase family serine peptidase [Bacteroidota bacterium]
MNSYRLMFSHYKLASFFITFLIFANGCQKKERQKETISVTGISHPYAKKKSHSKDLHGVILNDEYFWLHEKGNPEVIDHLQKENQYVNSIMQQSNDLQQLLYQELLGLASPEIRLIKKIGTNEYFSRTDTNKAFPVFFKKTTNPNKEEIILDFNKYLSIDSAYSLAFIEVSPDQQQYSYAIIHDTTTTYSLIIKNFLNPAVSDTIPDVSHFAAWAEDSQTIFYTTQDETGRTDKVFNHKIYLPYEEDKMEYYEEDPNYFVSVTKSKNNQYILVQSEGPTSSETYFLNASDPNQDLNLFAARRSNFKYEVFPHQNFFLIIASDFNGFAHKQLFKASVGATDFRNWQLIESYKEGISLEYLDLFKDYLVLFKSKNGIPFLETKDLSNNTAWQIFFDDSTSIVKPVNTTFLDEMLRYELESLSAPKSIYQVDLKTKKQTLLNTTEIKDFNKDDYKTERIHVQAEDGAQIPVDLVYHKDTKTDGTAPLYYCEAKNIDKSSHSFQTSSAEFKNRVSLLNRGFIFAFAQVRGTNGLGLEWRQKGRGLLKKNGINDYITCAKYLVQQKYTGSDRIVALGEGIGAILIAASINLEPGLFHTIIFKNPKTDILDSLPIDYNISKAEFGDLKDEDDFTFMLTYSPYDNIEVKAYPNILIFSDFHNTPFHYYEAAKWAARLREYNTDPYTIILLNTNFENNRTYGERLKETAMEYTFIIDRLGLDIKPISINRP